ncbi:MAG TPA: hybrid sensor histidine kinase/response regulator [Ideonella sp.]|uniref:ATP-binding response regulator n=1 Tax=Ideonella sp. TaxID=1929293 RepID=UPI002E31D303|nr:hybrid sensor histidine kinase/response regulator [Ideonella sp.]HEX5685168.1 hybrid sensor histidine kinase/response regulator [Ideonella sp.]
MRDAALQAVAGGAAPAAAFLLSLLPGLLLLKWSGTNGPLWWVMCVGVLSGLWWLLARAVTRRLGWLGDTRQQRLLLGALAAGCVAALVVLAGLPNPAWASGAPSLLVLVALAPTLAFVLAPMREGWLAVALASSLPAMVALVALVRDGVDDAEDSFQILSYLALGLGSTLLARWRWRSWAHDQRALIQRDDRIRELELACSQARRAEQEKTRFLASASHDLRQPMHALGLFAATLEKRLVDSAEEPLVRNVMRSVDGLERSFNVMLDVSRLDAGTVDPNIQHFPLRDLFRRLHMQYSGQAEQAGLGLRFSPGGKSVSSDPQLLERILGNLIQNAIKYTDAGGIVVVARSTATHVNVEVWDTGVGIAADDLPRVFDEFCQVGRDRRARAQGLGMGLAIVKRLAKLLGHRLSVRSRPGGGTMFRIGIQIGGLPGIQDATAAADTLPMPVLQPCSVLVIDDEAPIRESLRILLEEWGYDVVCAATAQQAESAVQTQELPPDLILSDLHLGPGPDGIAAIDAVRRIYGYEVPAILVTGDTSHEELRRATDSGHTVLFKPLQARKLFNALHGLGG